LVGLSSWPVLHGNRTCAATVEGRAEHADGGVALAHVRALKVEARVQLVGRRAGVATCLSRLSQRGGEVGRLVWGRVGAIARRRLDIDRRGGLCHGARHTVRLLRAVWEQREAAVACVLEQKLGVGQLAGHKLVRLAVPGIKVIRTRVLLGAPEMRRGRLLHRSGDGSARCGAFARRVGEGWRRSLVGIQLHGGGGTVGGNGYLKVGWRLERWHLVPGYQGDGACSGAAD
jgi:hypothetical protein